MPTTAAPPAPAAALALVTQMAEDTRHTAAELVEILAHCSTVVASAEYRMLQAASLIHDKREEEYLVEVSDRFTGEADSPEELLSRAAGAGPRGEFGPDGLERAVCEVGAALTVTPTRARQLIIAGDALRHRLPLTGHALATGRIDLARFLLAVARTDVCGHDTLLDVDAHLAQEIFARAPMAMARFRVMVDAIVARIDPDSLLARRERAQADRKVRVRPDRHVPGQSRVSASLPAVTAAEFDARLTAMAREVHRGDGRSTEQRRADAMVALSRGQQHLTCECADCADAPTVEPDDTAADETADAATDLAGAPSPEPAAPDASPAPKGDSCSHATKPVFHIVVNLSTLLGLDDEPGFLDGHGIIDADTMRSLLADAEREFLRPETLDKATLGYVPSKKLQALVRAGELCCAFPGCSNPVRSADLDHTRPFCHSNPRSGGATRRSNLKPLCRLHHRAKTFLDWRDRQDEMGTVFFESPTGHMFLGNAFTGADLFSALRSPPRQAGHPAGSHLDRLRGTRRDAHRRAIHEWDEANPPPF